MSSNEYARRPRLARPISISMRRAYRWPVGQPRSRAASTTAAPTTETAAVTSAAWFHPPRPSPAGVGAPAAITDTHRDADRRPDVARGVVRPAARGPHPRRTRSAGWNRAALVTAAVSVVGGRGRAGRPRARLTPGPDRLAAWRSRSAGPSADAARTRSTTRDRALAAHPRPRGGLGRLADRRLPLRAADPGRADGLGDVPADRDRLRQARRPRRARPRGPLDPVRRPEPTCSPRSPGSTGRGPPRRLQEIYAEPIKPELITARLQEMRDVRRHRRRLAVAAAHQGVRQDRRRRRLRHVRDPRHDGVRRARLRRRPSR